MTLPKLHKPLTNLQTVLTLGLSAIVLFKLTQGRFIAVNTLSQVATITLATGAGYALGWFLSPQAKAFRTAIMVGVILLTTLVCLGTGLLGWTYATVAGWIGFFAALGLWLGTTLRDIFNYRPTTFGSAEWATLPYLQDNGLIGREGIRLGMFDTQNESAPLHYNGDRHLLTIAPTRSGKGTTAIIPNLLTYKGSCLVIDPKGENALITASQRIAMGQDVHILDPWGIASGGKASCFNPLDWLDPSDPDIGENAFLLADALVVSEDTAEKFWIEEAKALLCGLILHVALHPDEQSHRHLGRVRDLLLLDGEDMQSLWKKMAESAQHHIIASTGVRCLQKDEKLFANVLASAQSQSHFLDSPRLRASLAESSFRFEDLKTKAMTIYIVLPVHKIDSFSRWLRLLIQQAITVNATNITVKPTKPVLFILDEMPALKRLTMVEQAYSLMAGFGVLLWGICQDVNQLAYIYGKGWEGFVANSGVVIYGGSRDRMSAEYFSALTGVTTVQNISSALGRAFSFSSGPNGGSSSSSSNSTDTSSAVQRKLAYPDELMRLPGNRQLVLIENHHPIQARKVRWFEDEALKDLGRNLFRQ